MSRLSIELTNEQHQMLKAVAAMNGNTIREYVLSRILPAVSEEAEALKELESFLMPRLNDAQRGNTVSLSATQIFEETLNKR